MKNDSYYICINCNHIISSIVQNNLKAKVNCPKCNLKDAFGLNVFNEDFSGYTFEEIIAIRNKKPAA